MARMGGIVMGVVPRGTVVASWECRISQGGCVLAGVPRGTGLQFPQGDGGLQGQTAGIDRGDGGKEVSTQEGVRTDLDQGATLGVRRSLMDVEYADPLFAQFVGDAGEDTGLI